MFTGKFWVLIDSTVYSASDSFARFCKDTGFAELVGTASSGGGMGLSPMILALPGTGICVRFSPMSMLNSDGSYSEEVGTIPDVLLKPEEDALAACLKRIAQ